MNRNIRLLHLEDVRADADIVARELKKSKLKFDRLWVTNKKDFQKALKEFSPDIILSDHSLPSFSSMQALKMTQDAGIDIPFILITSVMSDESAVNLVNEGVTDYLLKDRLQRLPNAVHDALGKSIVKKEKKVFEKVEQSEKLFRALTEHGVDMKTLSTQDGTILYGSPSITKVLGYSPEEYLHAPAFELIHSDDIPGLMEQMMDVIQTPGKSFYRQQRLKHKDGTWRWCEGTITNMLDEPGVNALVSNFRDITEKKNVEETLVRKHHELEETEKKLNEAQEIAQMGSWELDFATGRAVWSKEACLIYGISPQENVQSFESWVAFIYPEDKEYVNNEIKKSQISFSTNSMEHRIICKTGVIKYVSSISKFVLNELGKPTGLVGIFQDITERKIAQEKLAKSEIQIWNFAKHTNQVLEDERSHLAREIHDELGQQLVAIKFGLSSFQKLNASDIVLGQWVNGIKDEVDNTINSMRKIATELRPGILDSLGLIPSIQWLVDEFAKRTGIKCTVHANKKEQKFDKNISTCFFRICQEALTNISKHANATKVTVKITSVKNVLELIIIDNGKGISSEKLENPFSMGLLGMRERAIIIGGDLQITSKKKSGTTIQLSVKLK
jgi:PAS domain S-box-containing protein